MKRRIIFATLLIAAIASMGISSIKQDSVEEVKIEPIVVTPEEQSVAAAPEPIEPEWLVDVPLDESLQEHIWNRCNEYGIVDNYELIYAVIRTESNYTANIVSSTDDYGLMQINACNHDWLGGKLGIVDFLDPYQNVDAGIYLLQYLLNKYDTVEEALMCYNLGEGGAAKRWRDGVYTTSYTEKVLAYYNEIIKDI